MNANILRCCLFGGQEKDLFVLGELHKRSGVEVAFVYDKDPGAVGLEIAEILGLPHPSTVEDLQTHKNIDYVVVSEPREMFASELDHMASTGAKIVSQPEAMEMFGAPVKTPVKPPEKKTNDGVYSIEDALSAFERLFDRKELLKFLLDVAVSATDATAGSIMLYSPESAELHIAYATGLSERVVRNTRQKLGEGIAGAVASERKGKLIREPAGKPLYPADRDRSGIRSAISVHLEWESRLLGVLNVSSDSPTHELNETGLAALEKLSVRISRVLYQSLKMQETKIQHKEMDLRQSMGELSEKSISTQAKFSLISNMLGKMTGAEAVEVFVGTQEGDWLILGGSSRRYTPKPEMVRCERGALSRAYLESRTIVLTEATEKRGKPEAVVSSFVFVPLVMGGILGVLMLEFSNPQQLDDFLVIKDSVSLELSRFIASEKRERRLRRELEALGKVSDAAPVMLTCRTMDDLCDFLARLISDVLEAERVSVRIKHLADGPDNVSRFESLPDRSGEWETEDDERYEKLSTKQQPFSLAFLNFAPEAGEKVSAYHSVLGTPVFVDETFRGGVIAYDKHSTNPMEDATFCELDRSIVGHIVSMATQALRYLSKTDDSAEPGTGAPAVYYDDILHGNLTRLKSVIESEMSRSDRYHHAFSLLVIKIRVLSDIFDTDESEAVRLVEEITRGIQTRTRKTDYGVWIKRDTFVMVSLEGSRRIQFLVGRLMLYLLKDFASVAGMQINPTDVLVGNTFYPGTAKTPEAMLDEVENNLKPYEQGESP